MKRIIIGVVSGVLFISLLVGGLVATKRGISLVPGVRAQENEARTAAVRPDQFGRRLYCTNGTVQGRYATNLQGSAVAGPAVLPFASISVSHFDGYGNLTVVDLVSVNGNISPTAPFRFRRNLHRQ